METSHPEGGGLVFFVILGKNLLTPQSNVLLLSSNNFKKSD